VTTNDAGSEPQSTAAFFATVYDELKRIARKRLRAGGGHVTLCTTELVHEVYFKLARGDPDWEGRAHFFGAASRAMRQVLVDFARKRLSAKRGGGGQPVTLGDAEVALELELEEILDLDAALDRLEAVNPRLRQVVELRFFAGLPEVELADLLGVSLRTIERDWLKARLFLLEHMERGSKQ
jgi:RNA polymerase sigma factor (TIGR02999 family)